MDKLKFVGVLPFRMGKCSLILVVHVLIMLLLSLLCCPGFGWRKLVIEVVCVLVLYRAACL